jgi:hypothetical protein
METLIEVIQHRKPTRFRPSHYYCAEADALTFYFRQDEFYASRVDDLLTVYLAMDTNDLVGCQVKGIRDAIQKRGALGLQIENEDVDLDFLFFLNGMCASVTAKPRYLALAKLALKHNMRGRISGHGLIPAGQCEPPSLGHFGQ